MSSLSGIKCKWDKSENQIKCLLPITLPTSKVRIKRRGLEPVAPRKIRMSIEDFIEWQISYKDEEGRLVEFGEILSIAYNYGIIQRDDICLVIKEFKNTKTFAETFYITREIFSQNSSFYGFKILYEKTPILHSDLSDGCYVEIVLRHKQKAVGYQPMIYIYIPLRNVTPNLIGRTASEKQLVIWIPRKEHVLELLKAFIIASEIHRRDIIDICLKVVKSCP